MRSRRRKSRRKRNESHRLPIVIRAPDHRHLGRLVLVAVFLSCFGVPGSPLLAQPRKRGQSAAMTKRERIAEIMEETLRRGEGSVQGVRTYTRVPQSGQAVAELRRMGPEGIALLAEYTSSGTARQKSFAIELLGRIGGTGIIAPLDQVLRTCPSASFRQMALRWLPSERNDVVRQILTRTAESDSDSEVRSLAQRRLAEDAAK